ncbi:TetR/AcrR family transcriptional regulator [Rhodococcus qingshengii]|uniref:TetR/AcrR family transcriptional regulator n=1 Tax=Rhodococcus qingshengii TaxID=334542 RepID=UPI001C214751|nr:TetR/AcrR family transcriptional regulator [Rhodococcus qingshengii]QXC46871.1 TetR/AcrR family transcriptional regulator [Rhodococcus qingshengii]
MDAMSQAPVRRSPGRPRDPEVDTRILAAAREVYSARGWSGFTLDEVARSAQVSKGALYLRWADKATLILDAVRTQVPSLGGIDTGALRSDLVEFAHQWGRFIRSKDGTMLARLGLDQRFYPEIDAAFKAAPFPSYISDTITIVRRGIKQGELPKDTSASLVGDLVAGAVTNHMRQMPEAKLNDSHLERFIADVIDIVLAGVNNR